AGVITRTTDYTYDEARRWTDPITSSSKTTNTSTNAESTPITTSRTFDDYRNVTTSTDPMGVRTDYVYNSTTHLLSSVSQPISSTQTQYTEYTRNAQGTVTQVVVRDTNASGTLLQQVNYNNIDAYGNV